MNKSKLLRIALKQIADRIGFVQGKHFTLRTVYGPIFHLYIDDYGENHYFKWTKNGSQKIIVSTHPNTLEDQIIELCNLHG